MLGTQAVQAIVVVVPAGLRTPGPAVQNVSIDHGGSHVTVAEELHGPNVVPVFQQVGCERVAQCVRGRQCVFPTAPMGNPSFQ